MKSPEARVERALRLGARSGAQEGVAVWYVLLSHDIDVSPNDWEFSRLPGGRPVVTGPVRGGTSPWFSLSHTNGMVVCGGTHVAGLALERHAALTPPEVSLRRWFSSGKEPRG